MNIPIPNFLREPTARVTTKLATPNVPFGAILLLLLLLLDSCSWVDRNLSPAMFPLALLIDGCRRNRHHCFGGFNIMVQESVG